MAAIYVTIKLLIKVISINRIRQSMKESIIAVINVNIKLQIKVILINTRSQFMKESSMAAINVTQATRHINLI